MRRAAGVFLVACITIRAALSCLKTVNNGATTINNAATVKCNSTCPTGYSYFAMTNECYKAVVENSIQSVARQACQRDGGDLASIHSQAENDFIFGLLPPTTAPYNDNCVDNYNLQAAVWIGLIFPNAGPAGAGTAQMNSGEPAWTDGTAFDYSNFHTAAAEPDNICPTRSTCGLLLWSTDAASNGEWDDDVCNVVASGFICEHAACTP